MADLNPFEAPSEKPPSDARLTDQERLRLPASARARESFGDRYFWLILVLLGVAIMVVPPLVADVSAWKPGVAIVICGFVVWLHDCTARLPRA
jgi:hypothetical protein